MFLIYTGNEQSPAFKFFLAIFNIFSEVTSRVQSMQRLIDIERKEVKSCQNDKM